MEESSTLDGRKATHSGHLTILKWVRAMALKGNLLKKVMTAGMKSHFLP
jgi:hypothetical protein